MIYCCCRPGLLCRRPLRPDGHRPSGPDRSIWPRCRDGSLPRVWHCRDLPVGEILMGSPSSNVKFAGIQGVDFGHVIPDIFPGIQVFEIIIPGAVGRASLAVEFGLVVHEEEGIRFSISVDKALHSGEQRQVSPRAWYLVASMTWSTLTSCASGRVSPGQLSRFHCRTRTCRSWFSSCPSACGRDRDRSSRPRP